MLYASNTLMHVKKNPYILKSNRIIQINIIFFFKSISFACYIVNFNDKKKNVNFFVILTKW